MKLYNRYAEALGGGQYGQRVQLALSGRFVGIGTRNHQTRSTFTQFLVEGGATGVLKKGSRERERLERTQAELAKRLGVKPDDPKRQNETVIKPNQPETNK